MTESFLLLIAIEIVLVWKFSGSDTKKIETQLKEMVRILDLIERRSRT